MGGNLLRFAGRTIHFPLAYVGGKAFAGLPSNTATHALDLTGLSGGLASSASPGDFMVLSYGDGSNADFDMSVSESGWTEQLDRHGGTSSNNHTNLGIYTKFMSGTPDTTATINMPGGETSVNKAPAATLQVWRNVNVGTPLDVSLVSSQDDSAAAGAAQPDCPSITPVTAGAVILCIGVGSGAVTTNLTQPGSELSNFLAASSSSVTYDTNIAAGWKQWTSGAFDPVKWTGGYTLAFGSSVAATLALRPS